MPRSGKAIEEIALGLVELGIEPGDRVALLADTRRGVDARELRDLGRRRASWCRSTRPTRRTSASGCWATRAPRRRSARTRVSAQKIEQVRGEPAELEHVIGIEAGGRRDDARRAPRARPRARSPRADASVRRRSSRMTRTRSSTPRARPGRRRASCSRHRNAMSVCQIVEELAFVQPGELTYLYLPLAHVFALITQLASFDQGTAIIYFGGDTRQILAELIETQADVPPVGAADLREALRRGDEAAGAGERGGPRALPAGGQARRRGARGASAASPYPRSCASRSSRPTSRSSPACASCSGATSARRSPAPRRSRRRSSSSSTPPACRCSRAGA